MPRQMPWQSKLVIIKLCIKTFLTALADATNDLSMSCHEQRTGAATVFVKVLGALHWLSSVYSLLKYYFKLAFVCSKIHSKIVTDELNRSQS